MTGTVTTLPLWFTVNFLACQSKEAFTFLIQLFPRIKTLSWDSITCTEVLIIKPLMARGKSVISPRERTLVPFAVLITYSEDFLIINPKFSIMALVMMLTAAPLSITTTTGLLLM